MKKLTAIIIGAGDRGRVYAGCMKEFSDRFQVIGIAEPMPGKRIPLQEQHGVADEYTFDSWEKILAVPKFADIAVIATLDRLHCAPALKALELGYDLLLEKPIAPTPEECMKVWRQAEKYGRKVMVCHVLRYTPYFNRMKRVLKSGIIGDVLSIVHNEDVGPLHQAHSFVRGNWGNTARSSCMLLQKSCHDFDILQWLLEKDFKRVQSFGSRSFYRLENAPEGSPEFCIEGCPHSATCIYDATKAYINDNLDEELKSWYRRNATQMENPTREDAEKAIRTNQYGKCVFKCDNDVVDHQTVNMEFEGGTTAVFTMCATGTAGRTTKIMGTKGWIWGDIHAKRIEIRVHGVKGVQILDVNSPEDGDPGSGHDGGDAGIVEALYEYINGEKMPVEVSEVDISCKNHMATFAAEHSRLNGCVVDLEEYMRQWDAEI